MKINASEIRVGMLLEYKNDLWEVLKTQHVKPGKGGAFAQVEMKSVGKNTKLNERFRSSETVEKASLDENKYNYMYEDDANYFFMEPKTFEQIEIKKEIIGITCHNSIKLAKEAIKNKANYIAFGAFYSTKTKKAKYRANIKTLNKVKKLKNIPIVAIGGITNKNYKKLLLNNANFLAISGYIWKNKKYKPAEAIESLK